jgi:hypothetical protein
VFEVIESKEISGERVQTSRLTVGAGLCTMQIREWVKWLLVFQTLKLLKSMNG